MVIQAVAMASFTKVKGNENLDVDFPGPFCILFSVKSMLSKSKIIMQHRNGQYRKCKYLGNKLDYVWVTFKFYDSLKVKYRQDDITIEYKMNVKGNSK